MIQWRQKNFWFGGNKMEQSGQKIICGAQLYTVRNLVHSSADLPALFEKLRGYGVTVAQVSGIGNHDPAYLRRVADENGIRLPVTHSAQNRIQKDLDNLAKEHQILGADTIGLSALGGWMCSGRFGMRAFCRFADRTSERLKDYGLKFAVHNHNREFRKVGGTELLFQYLKNTRDTQFIPDVYWIKAAGYDPVEVIERLSGRVTHVHIKDYQSLPDGSYRIADLGEGELDFPAILKACENAGAKYAYIEHDDTREPLRSIQIGMDYLRTVYG